MRLNLPRYHCVRFGVFSEFAASDEQDANIRSFLSQTSTHSHDSEEDDEESTLVSLFASRSKTGGVTHRLRFSVSRRLRQNVPNYTLSIDINRASDRLPPPPRGCRPVSVLVEAAPELFGIVDVRCIAAFEYSESDGFRSKISYPLPLIVQDDGDGITHIESAEFSRRDAEGIQYRILTVNSEDPVSCVHSVNFETATDLGRVGIRKLLDRARSISSQLVVKTGDN